MGDDSQSSLSNPTRRAFLQTTRGTTTAAVMAECGPAHPNSTLGQSASPPEIGERPHIEGAVPITLRINGKDRQLHVDPRTTLLDCIRETVALTGTKKAVTTGNAARVRCMSMAGA